MRTSVASISKKFISTFFAVTLALGLVPVAAFAVEDNGEASPQNSEFAEANSDMQAEAEASAYENISEDIQDKSVEGEPAPSNGEEGIEDNVVNSNDPNLAIPAAMERVNEDVALTTRTVAQAESSRTYFLAQTLESTKTVPIVSANLPLDTGAPREPSADSASSGEEGGEDSDESDLPGIIAAESTVVGSFTSRGMTYAIEAGGESVALVAVDCNKFPQEFIEKRTVVIPAAVVADNADYYSVTRIADYAFASIGAHVSSSEPVSDEANNASPADDAEEAEEIADISDISMVTIPASVTSIGEEAFSGFDTLQYLVVSEGNPAYSTYDGCLYNADLTSLLSIPGGRLGAVRIAPSVTEVNPKAFSHCPLVDAVVTDADSAAYQLLSESVSSIEPRIEVLTTDELSIEPYTGDEAASESADSGVTALAFEGQDRNVMAGKTTDNRYTTYTITFRNTDTYNKLYMYEFKRTYNSSGGHTDTITRANSEKTGTVTTTGYAVYSRGGQILVVKDNVSTASPYYQIIECWTPEVSGRRVTGWALNGTTINNQQNYDLSADSFLAWNTELALMNITVVHSGTTRYSEASSMERPVGSTPTNTTISEGTKTGNFTITGYQIINDGVAVRVYYDADTSGLPNWQSSKFRWICPEKPGYTVTSWTYNGATLGKYTYLQNMGNGNLVPVFTANTYTVVYDGNGNMGGSTASSTHTYDVAKNLTANGFTNIGYSFAGWADSASGAVAYANGASVINLVTSGTKTLYAKWTANTYTVAYNGNGNTGGSTASSTHTYDSVKGLTANGFTRTGYSFAGWADSASGAVAYANCAPVINLVTSGTKTLYAKWTANTYTVSFSANGGSGGQTANVTATYAANMPGISATKPTRTGYTFGGYYDTSASTGGTQYYTAACASARTWNKTEGATLYARWTANTNTVSFSANGGSGGQTANVTATYAANMPGISATKPTRTGYTFGGYYDTSASTGGTQYYTAACASARTWNKTANTTLHARWTANTYTVSFSANGGSGGQSANVTATYDSGMPAISTAAPVRAGWTFKGWYDGTNYAASTQYYTAGGASARTWNKTSAATLYAGWSANTITLTWNSHGGSAVSNTTQTFSEQAKVSVPTAPGRPGYNFNGWYTAASGGTQVTSSTALPSGNTTYHAQWSAPISYTITLNTGGGSVSGWTQVTANQKYTKSYNITSAATTLPTPSRTGYSFSGWTGANGTTAQTSVTVAQGSYGDKSYTASWTPIGYTITLNTGGGSVSGWTTAAANSKYTKGYNIESADITLPTPTRNGYTFNGWTGANGTTAQTTVKVTKGSTGDKSYTASWTPITYTITYQLNGGTNNAGNPGTFTPDSSAITLADPTKTGHDFKGWYAESDFSGSKVTSIAAGSVGNRTLYAKWEARKNTVTWTDATTGFSKTETWAYGATVTMPDPTARTAYTFDGWQVSNSSDGGYFRGGTKTFTMVDAPVSFVATWHATPYEVTVDLGTAQRDLGTPTLVTNGTGTTWSIDFAGRVAKATYTVESGAVTLPTFALSGYDYELSGTGIANTAQSFSFTPGTGANQWHQPMTYAITWVECPYAIEFVGVDHVMRANAPFPKTDSINLSALLNQRKTYDLDALTASAADETAKGGVFDADRYASFTGWKLMRLENGRYTELRTESPLSIALSDFGDKTTVYVQPVFELNTWRVTLDTGKTDGSTWPSSIDGWSKDGQGRFYKEYTCVSGRVALPSGMKLFGYRITDWTIASYRTDESALGTAFGAVNANGTFFVGEDKTLNLYAKPVWTPTESLLMFDLGTTDTVSGIDAATFPNSANRAFKVTFDAKKADGTPDLPVMKRETNGTTYVLQTPTRTGYEFLGYFDDAGMQYYTADRRPVRTWDKEPLLGSDNTTKVPYVLTAKWRANEPSPDPDAPRKKPADTDEPTYIRLTATQYAGGEVEVLDAVYNGLMQWTSTEDRPAANDTVVVDVASFIRSESEESYLSRMHDAFDHEEAVDRMTKTRYLIGFEVGSCGGYVSLSSLAKGESFSLTLKGSDLTWNDAFDAPADAFVGRDHVSAVYSDVPGGTGPLAEGEEVVTMFDAGPGSFSGKRVLSIRTRVGEDATRTPVTVPDDDPKYPGYEFLGWSSAPHTAHTATDAHFTRESGTRPVLTSRTPATYYAHWAPKTYAIAFDLNYEGSDAEYSVQTVFDQLPASLTATEAQQSQNARGEDYVLTGWFDTRDATGGTMLFDRNGVPRVSAWTDPTEPARVYARWAYDTTGEVDPFPPAPGPKYEITDDSMLKLIVTVGTEKVTVLNGTYDGVFRFDASDGDGRPTDDASVQVTVNAYAPAAGASRKAALEKIESDLESLAAGQTQHYLQGFRLRSTGDFISWGAIMEGRSFDIDCKGADLIWDDVFQAPADAQVGAGIEVVYGSNPSYPPFGESEPIEVVNVFDAGLGTFPGTNGKHLLDVRSTYGERVKVPSADSDLPASGDPTYLKDLGYYFAGWYDAAGNAPGTQNTTASRTFYARYVQETHRIDFHVDSAAGSIVNRGTDDATSAVELWNVSSANPYHNQSFTTVSYPEPVYHSTFFRDGYDFLGWFSTPELTDGTKAYFLTDAGLAYPHGEDGTLEDILVDDDVRVLGNTDMYALWAAKTYDLTWHWNYPDYERDGVVYPGTRNDAEADVFRTYENVRYGQPFTVPSISDDLWRFRFDAWFTAADVTDRDDRFAKDVRNDIDGVAGMDGTYFMPGHYRSLQAESGLDYYAAWTGTDEPKPHRITLHPGQHGYYSDGDEPVLTYYFTMSVPLEPKPTGHAGWQPAGWVAADGNGDPLSDDADTVTEVAAGTTGDLHFVMTWIHGEYSVALEGLDDVDLWPLKEIGWEDPVRAFELDDGYIAFPSVSFMRENAVKPGYRFMGWSRTGEDDATMAEGLTPNDFITSEPDTTQAVYKAVWQPIEYTIVFDPRSGDAHDVVIEQVTYGDSAMVELPTPVIRSGMAGVFSHWGTENNDYLNVWKAATKVSMPTLLNKYTPGGVLPSAEVSGMKDGHLVEETFPDVIVVQGVWSQMLSVDAPLQVVIAVDPESKDVVSSDAWLASRGESAVEVIGLACDKAASSEDGGGTDNVFAGAADKVDLTVRAVRIDNENADAAAQSAEDMFANANEFKLNLGSETFLAKGDVASSFSTFGDAGSYLKIRYGLSFDDSITDLKAFLKNLPDNDAGGPFGWSSKRFPIANLYYTVGLAS